MFYLVKKPLGISSNLVAKILKRVLKVEKIGFAGTLDPLASGLMIIGTGGTPRLFPLIEDRPKKYCVTMRLDGTTDSYDLEHPVKEVAIAHEIVEKVDASMIQKVIEENFLGDILQIPPTYSASWVDGKRAYERARKGEIMEIHAKPRTVSEWRIVDFYWPELISEITVSHGTYIRSLVRDLGEKLQTGGYLTLLERTEIAGLVGENREWIQHNDISYAPISHEEMFPEIPFLDFNTEEKDHLRLGSTPLSTKQKNGLYFVRYDSGDCGLLEVKDELIYPVKNCV